MYLTFSLFIFYTHLSPCAAEMSGRRAGITWKIKIEHLQSKITSEASRFLADHTGGPFYSPSVSDVTLLFTPLGAVRGDWSWWTRGGVGIIPIPPLACCE